MAKLQNIRHERFAREYSMGKTGSDAYRLAYGGNPSGAGQMAYDLLRRLEIWERIEELQLKHAENVALSADEMHSFLRDTVEIPIGSIDEKHRLCNEMTISPDGSKKLKMPDKLKALELAAKLQGMLGGNGAGDGKPHVRLQLIASGASGVAAQLDIM